MFAKQYKVYGVWKLLIDDSVLRSHKVPMLPIVCLSACCHFSRRTHKEVELQPNIQY